MNKGLVSAIGASMLFGTAPNLSKLLQRGGMSPVALIFWYALIGAAFNAASAKAAGAKLRVPLKAGGLLAAVGVACIGATSLLLNSSYLYIPVGVATVAHFLYPTIVAAAMALFFGQRFTLGRLFAAVLSVAGMALIAGGKLSASFKGYALALASSATYSFYLVAMDRFPFGGIGTSAMLFWMNLSSCALCGALALFGGIRLAPPSFQAAMLMLLCAALVIAAYKLLLAGVSSLGASTAAFATMAEPITSLAVSSLLYPADRISPRGFVGIGLILCSILLASLKSGERFRT